MMKLVIALISVLCLSSLTGCITDGVQPTRTIYVQASVPSQLIDCDRFKRTKTPDIKKLTERDITIFIANREKIINECFKDAADLRAFLAKNKLIIEKQNTAK